MQEVPLNPDFPRGWEGSASLVTGRPPGREVTLLFPLHQ